MKNNVLNALHLSEVSCVVNKEFNKFELKEPWKGGAYG